MTLSWKIHGEVNPTVSIIEVWANAPSTNGLRLSCLSGLPASLQGQVLNLAYDPVSNACVRVAGLGRSDALTTNAGPEGTFSFSRKEIESLAAGGDLVLTARAGGEEGGTRLNTAHLFFDPVHYRPLPDQTANLHQNSLLLDGVWALARIAANNPRAWALKDPAWGRFTVPGQWLQQDFDIPQDKPVAVAKEFIIPKAWTGNRIILRFDAIHAGTRYWLNGHELGYSENLFTPVEWDITDAALPGRTNRLDLEMKVATVSEALSYSSAYAFHNLGGIDRSVRLFALPPTHIRQLHLDAELDSNYRDGEVRLHLVLESGTKPETGLSLSLKLLAPNGKTLEYSLSPQAVEPFTGAKAVEFAEHVSTPLQWSAEKPNLYRLVLELRQSGTTLERVERNLGFRKIEIRGSKLYLNGCSIKLAGACHHEFDPLTGRANTAGHAETDVRLLKEANLNHIRTSHYPPTAELLDAADRLGMYVEVEAPFCWVGGALDNPTNLAATLTPTSAMLDYCHSHPSVIFWSLANESHFNLQFLASARMCKELDPTRPTTFNQDFAGSPLAALTDIANWHYPAWPYDKVLAGDSRPLYFGEYFFPVCHEQTDVSIDPGLRELWGQGQAEPDSEFGRACTLDSEKGPLKPGLRPGGWSNIYHSGRVIGGSIWASHDDAFYFSATNHAGYAWHHGFWGLIDCWRRPKPEWFLARHIFSPVWLETRHVGFAPGQKTIRVPVENRCAFTDFNELRFDYQINGHKGRIQPHLAPGLTGELEFPVPPGTAEGDPLTLRATAASGVLIDESSIQLGNKRDTSRPMPGSGAPQVRREGSKVIIQGLKFGMVFDEAKGDFVSGDPRHTCAVTSFPTVHVTRYDFGDLNGPNSPPYAVFPDAGTRHFEKVEIQNEPSGLRLIVHEHYKNFAGFTTWLIDKNGRGTVACDYTYSGPAMDTREAGIRFLMKPGCDEVKWQRWSEWSSFPLESISRARGTAKAHRNKEWGPARWNERPRWPWALDETELGTADFRSVKFNIYDAGLFASDGSGLSARADADAHFRAALAPGGVAANLLWRCPLGQVPLKSGDRLQGRFVVALSFAR
ncbi:MAG TPA: glycoside hydrolase family 2 TIM barrel-domain containing protein [Candidatus Binatia bacterium]|jgi:beta-galactosidase|nr:glycoside hydrolase family 2 TIM barrel-domain containing protein [Candidatus Binatia bacterium]